MMKSSKTWTPGRAETVTAASRIVVNAATVIGSGGSSGW
jgi:hypothetical protein